MNIEKLINVVIDYCIKNPKGFKEYDLICFIDQTIDLFSQLDKASSLNLFKKHFLIKHALYRCESILLEQFNIAIEINNVWISFHTPSATTCTELATNTAQQKLKHYYLDWDNFYAASEASVDELLDSFWRRFFQVEAREDACKVLGLSVDASQQAIKERYRQLAAKHHPDKGGNPDKFIALRSAYERLKSA